ncbi:tyrosine recombinase XerC [Terrabacter sp. GCM10028922]|uniref:site-specific integrase n=1 Tax=Terrabacter sp. GCM10028922 TaxID=3273428 RepID=UPI0036178BC2
MSGKRVRQNGEGSIFPYRNGFGAYVWITTPAGRRQRKYVYGKTREVVHAKWVALTQQAARGPVLTKVPTVGQYLHRWLTETVAPNLAPLTHATYESHVRNYIEPGLGKIRIDRLRVSDVQSWLNVLPSQCQCCTQGKDARRAERAPATARCCAKGQCCRSFPSARSIKDVRTVLRSALSSAMRDELVERNVAALVKTPRQRRRKVVPWSSDEARRFLESARSDGDPLYAAYILVLVLGLRKGEVLGLAWDAVDLDAGVVIVDHQLQRVRRELLRRETKTEASDADLPLPRLVSTALQLRRDAQEKDRMEAGEAWRALPEGPHLVFTGRFGTPVDPRTLNRKFTERCTLASVRHLTVHDARRTCATLLVDLDVHPRVIMRILRHADLSVTMEVYAKASSAATTEALRRLGDSLE